MHDFEKELTDWYACPAVTHTWNNSKHHFENAYQVLW